MSDAGAAKGAAVIWASRISRDSPATSDTTDEGSAADTLDPAASGTVDVQRNGVTSTITLMEIAP